MRRWWSLFAGVAVLLLGTQLAAAAEIKVLSAGAVGTALKALVADYEKQGRNTVALTFGNVGQIQDKLKAGEPADIIILSKPALDDLAKARGLAAGSAKPLGRVGMGVAVEAGAPKPNIATPEAFKAALLAASSIAYSDPAGGGSSGVFFDTLIQKLGIADPIRAKAVLIRGGSAADQITQGKAAMAVQNSSELIGVPGIQYVGPFPAADQNFITYSAGVAIKSGEPNVALSFIRFITSPNAAKRWQAAGFETAHP
ncbi:MAG TPA: substrate-binding domain-containing protein [Stellaceae bacterium]|jgi:molybdate transport system substrate-binding protein|nr:substrate-binding domain-containing protein [Stellaceae bacterium]